MYTNISEFKNKPQRIILIGYMGSGKSSVGQELAKKLNLPLIDTDNLISAEEGCSVAEIFNTKGESYFRHLEYELVHRMQHFQSCVISTGGGMPVYNENIKKLNETGTTIYLSVSVDIIIDRIHNDQTRPLVKNLSSKKKLFTYISEDLIKRIPCYQQSKIIINADTKTLNQICNEIIDKLNEKPNN